MCKRTYCKSTYIEEKAVKYKKFIEQGNRVLTDQEFEIMDHCNNSKYEMKHSFMYVKLEPCIENYDSTQNLDPLQLDNNDHMKMELLQDLKMEVEADSSVLTMNELNKTDFLKNVLDVTETKTEEQHIKIEYISNEASAIDSVLVSHGIIEGKISSSIL